MVKTTRVLQPSSFAEQVKIFAPIAEQPQYKPLTELLMYTQKLIKTKTVDVPEIIAKSTKDFGVIQGKRNWFYGFRENPLGIIYSQVEVFEKMI